MRSSRMRERRARASGWSTTVSCTRDTVSARSPAPGKRPQTRLPPVRREWLDAASPIRHSAPVIEYRHAGAPGPPGVRTSPPCAGPRPRPRAARCSTAAAALFAREGYLRTTMKAIAAEAGTSVETVYAQGSKPALLLACVDRELGGDDDDVPLTDRAEFAAALAQPSSAAVIEAFVRALTLVAKRASGLLVAFEDAATADVATAELWAGAEETPKGRLPPPGAGRGRPWPTPRRLGRRHRHRCRVARGHPACGPHGAPHARLVRRPTGRRGHPPDLRSAHPLRRQVAGMTVPPDIASATDTRDMLSHAP